MSKNEIPDKFRADVPKSTLVRILSVIAEQYRSMGTFDRAYCASALLIITYVLYLLFSILKG